MKRAITSLLLMCVLCLTCNAQTWWFKSTAFAAAIITNGVYHWDDWQDSNLLIKIDTDEMQATIFSKRTQVYSIYRVYNNGNHYSDGKGGKVGKFYVIDQDGDKGEMRVRTDKNGDMQIYVDFEDVAWVYSVVNYYH